MLHAYASPTVEQAERLARSGDRVEVLHKLRQLPLGDFCQLLLEVGNGSYGELTRVLPRMPSEQDQKQWTGNSGHPLMIKSCNIARLFEIISYRATGTGLSGKRMLDYGCGWGRLLRLMYYYSDFNQVYGADPWDRSLEVCRASGIVENLTLCEEVPQVAPFEGVKFDFAFAFSVFTHLSEFAARSVLRACRMAMAETGIFVITIRPIEFWELRKAALKATTIEKVLREHNERGFAFTPMPFPRNVESTTYGETSMTVEFLGEMVGQEGWELAFYDRDLMEPFQLIVALRPI
jgi:SAM-dependent methyltransferase